MSQKIAYLSVANTTHLTKIAQMLSKRVYNIFADQTTQHYLNQCGIQSEQMAIQDFIKIKKVSAIVIANIHPFRDISKVSLQFDKALDNIDLDRPTLIRYAAKNHINITIITDIKDYDLLQQELQNNDKISLEFRKKMAAKAFAKTSSYDTAIANWFNHYHHQKFPDILNLSFYKVRSLKNGDNSYQQAALYGDSSVLQGLPNYNQIQGQIPSFSNLNDANLATDTVASFSDPTVVVVKYNNPLGAASGQNIKEAFNNAFHNNSINFADTVIAVNRKIDENFAHCLVQCSIKMIVAPDITDDAKKITMLKTNMRIIVIGEIHNTNDNAVQIKSISNGILIQDKDNTTINQIDIVTKLKPSEKQIEDMLFANTICKYSRSTAAVLVQNKRVIGIGSGQTCRINAIKMAKNELVFANYNKNQEIILALESFFPYLDLFKIINKMRIKAIIQSGKSVKDKKIIKMANQRNLILAFTGSKNLRY